VTRFHRMGVWAHAPEVRHRDVKEHHGIDAAGAGDRGCSPGASGPGGSSPHPVVREDDQTEGLVCPWKRGTLRG
jgi:hypothetical protein